MIENVNSGGADHADELGKKRHIGAGRSLGGKVFGGVPTIGAPSQRSGVADWRKTPAPEGKAGASEAAGAPEVPRFRTARDVDLYIKSLTEHESSSTLDGSTDLSGTSFASGFTEISEKLLLCQQQYGPAEKVDHQEAVELQRLFGGQLESLQRQLSSIQRVHAGVAKQLVAEISLLQQEVDDLTSRKESPTWSAFDTIGRAILSMTIGFAVGYLCAATIAAFLPQSLLGKVLEGAISGASGAAASEIASYLGPRST